MSEEGNDGKRKRGIQASPVKLRKALVDAGIKTQAELAEKIADLEGLENAPRGLVNKIFRGQAVDLVSLERVARALNIESWQLYLDSEEINTTNDELQNEPTNKSLENKIPFYKNTRFWIPIFGVSAILVLAAFLYLQPRQNNLQDPIILNYDNLVKVLPFDGDDGHQLTLSLEKALQSEGFSIMPGSAAISPDEDPQTVLARDRVDYVFSGTTKPIGRYVAIKIYITDNTSTKQVWAGSILKVASDKYAQELFSAAMGSIQNPFKINETFPGSIAQENYLRGRASLDAEHSETNMLRAETLAQSALRSFPNYVKAQALLCRALTQLGVENGDPKKFEEAELHCADGSALDPDDIELNLSIAVLQWKRGKVDEALAILEEVQERDPNNTNAKVEYSRVLFELLTNGKMPFAEYKGLEILAQAENIEPGYWKIPSEKSRIFYMLSNLQEAISASNRALELDENKVTLSNNGTYNFCVGDFGKAEQAYRKITEMYPQEWAGFSQLAMTYYYNREYDAAIELYSKATDNATFQSVIPYQVWGNLGSIYHQRNELELAKEAYNKSIALLENVIAKGQNGAEQRAFRLALYLSVILADGGHADRDVYESLYEELEELTVNQSPATLANLAMGWVAFGEYDKGRELIDMVTRSCPGLTKSPDYYSAFVENSLRIYPID